jgi:hypothetical protein
MVAPSSAVKRTKRDVYDSFLSSIKVKNGWKYMSAPQHVFILNTGTTLPVQRRVTLDSVVRCTIRGVELRATRCFTKL